MPRYIFKQASTWEGEQTIDNKIEKRIKAKTLKKALKKLPRIKDRNWVHVGTEK